MITVSIIYPNAANATFDFDYYLKQHMPRAIELLSRHKGYRGTSVERGVSMAADQQAAPTYLAACFFHFDSIESFLEAFGPHAEELQTDILRYTNVPAQIQFNDIVVSHQAQTEA